MKIIIGRKNAALTKGERAVLILGGTPVQGKLLTDNEIGKRLGLSVSDVKALVHKICLKLGAHNRHEAISIALRHGRKITALSKEERAVLILAGTPVQGKLLNNTEIGERLGLSVNEVKTLFHKICNKLGAHNRHEAIHIALRRGEINLNEIYSFDELAECLVTLGPDMLRRIAMLIRQGKKKLVLTNKSEPIFLRTTQYPVLTKAEQQVIILVGQGYSNQEIASMLYLSPNSVKTQLYRIYNKLGTSSRSAAVITALKSREIRSVDICSPDELMNHFTPLGAEYMEQIADKVALILSQDSKQAASQT